MISGKMGCILLLTKVSFTSEVMRLDLPEPSSPQTQILTRENISRVSGPPNAEHIPVDMVKISPTTARVHGQSQCTREISISALAAHLTAPSLRTLLDRSARRSSSSSFSKCGHVYHPPGDL